jgi:hypothetical protein
VQDIVVSVLTMVIAGLPEQSSADDTSLSLPS